MRFGERRGFFGRYRWAILGALGVLVISGFVAFVLHAANVETPQSRIETVIPDERFPR